jgi:hypothetical protein
MESRARRGFFFGPPLRGHTGRDARIPERANLFPPSMLRLFLIRINFFHYRFLTP